MAPKGLELSRPAARATFHLFSRSIFRGATAPRPEGVRPRGGCGGIIARIPEHATAETRWPEGAKC
jgi:hypothetical protein